MTRVARTQKIKPTTSPRQAYVTLGMVVLTSLLFGLLVLPRIGPREHRLGTEAPAFSLPLVAGGEPGDRISLSALRGKVVVLDFWATWCGPCTEQGKILERFVAVPRPDVFVVGVNQGEPVAQLGPYFATHAPAYPMVSDLDERVGQSFSVRGLPTLVIVDKNGKTNSVTSGVVPYARLERLVADAAVGR